MLNSSIPTTTFKQETVKLTTRWDVDGVSTTEFLKVENRSEIKPTAASLINGVSRNYFIKNNFFFFLFAMFLNW